jgi:hypothetical protein
MLNISLGPFHWKRLADVPDAKVFHFNAWPEPHSTWANSIIANDKRIDLDSVASPTL